MPFPLPRGSRLALLLACLSIATPLILPSAALAHAIVIASTPALNKSATGPSIPIEVHFNSRIDQSRSRLLLISQDGTEKTLALAPTPTPDMLATKAEGVAPGSYRLRWLVLAVDGHITRGDIPFKVTAP